MEREVRTDTMAAMAADDRPGPEAEAVLSDARGRLRQALDQLPAELREVIVLRAGYGCNGSLSQQQVADRLGIGRRAVQSREMRALRELRKLVEAS